MSSDGIRPTEERIICIRDFPVPENRKILKGFLGVARYIGHMVPDLAMAAVPLAALDKDKVAFVWTSENRKPSSLLKLFLQDL